MVPVDCCFYVYCVNVNFHEKRKDFCTAPYTLQTMGHCEIELVYTVFNFQINSYCKGLGYWKLFLGNIYINNFLKEFFKKFLEFKCRYNAAVRYTANYPQKEQNFLDISVKKENNQLVTGLYIKPIDEYQYLHFRSCHWSRKKITSFSTNPFISG